MIPLWKSELHVYPAHISQKSLSVTNISFNWQTSVLGTIALGQSNCKHSFCTSFHCAQVIVILYQVSLSSMFPKLSGVTASPPTDSSSLLRHTMQATQSNLGCPNLVRFCEINSQISQDFEDERWWCPGEQFEGAIRDT